MPDPIIWLPGMMCDARLFGPQIAAFGGTALPLVAQDSMTEMARAVLSVAPPRFALAGLSMGGIVAMEVVRLAPERVSRLALMDPNPLAESSKVAARRGPQIAAAEQGRMVEVVRDEMKPHYLADGPNRQVLLDLCVDMARALGAEAFINQSRALRDRPDQQDTLRSTQVPALVLCGRHDGLCPVHRHELMHDLLPNSTLTIIEEAGHLPTLEQPQQTNAALRDWLETDE